VNTKTRLTTHEQLDDLSLSGKPLETTLSSLRFINSLFGNHKNLGKALLKHLNNRAYSQKTHIVDLGCGGGDSISYLLKKLKNNPTTVSFTGIDGNPESISYASRNISNSTFAQFVVADILDTSFELPECTILISSHFMYHFSDLELINFLQKIQSKSIKHIIFSELYRSKMAFYVFKYASFILPISKIAKKDGLIAIQRAFSISELTHIIRESGFTKFEIQKKPFFRMLIKIDL